MMLASVDLDPNTFTPIRASYYDPAVLVGTKQNSITPVLYPNPANEMVYISNLKGGERIELSSLAGRLLASIDIKQGETAIQMSLSNLGIAPGVYYLNVVSATGLTSTQALIIQD